MPLVKGGSSTLCFPFPCCRGRDKEHTDFSYIPSTEVHQELVGEKYENERLQTVWRDFRAMDMDGSLNMKEMNDNGCNYGYGVKFISIQSRRPCQGYTNL